MTNSVGIATLAEEIESYLLAHPNASDTIEGIVKWWVALQYYERKRRDIEDALELLVSQGTVAKRRLSDGRFIYTTAVK